MELASKNEDSHFFDGFLLIQRLVDGRLDFKSRGEPIGIVGGVAVRVANGVHIAEAGAEVVTRGTLPPNSSGTGRTVPVLLGVSLFYQ